jgi:hypothetical protein
MTFFTQTEYNTKYGSGALSNDDLWLIEVASEMIFSQVGLRYRQAWDSTSVPLAIKNASMEQCRFLLEYQIPLMDNRGVIKAGNMTSDLKTHYSELAMMMLSNAGYIYRGVPINYNMEMEMPF